MNVKVYGLIEGLMVYWDEVKNAASYHVHLFIGDWNKRTEVINGRQTVVMDEKPKLQEIALVDVDRNFKFYSFSGLATIHDKTYVSHGNFTSSVVHKETGLQYYVVVEAEDRNGKIIDSSEKVVGTTLRG